MRQQLEQAVLFVAEFDILRNDLGAQEGLQVIPEDPGGFLQRIGNALEEVHQDDDVEHRHRAGQDQRPDGIHQAQIAHQQIVGNQTAVEERYRFFSFGDAMFIAAVDEK